MMNKRWGIGCDHAGYSLKDKVIKVLEETGMVVEDFGCNSDSSVDYPDFAHPVGEGIDNGSLDFGVVICGSGNGINMTVNKHSEVRSALCWTSEIAELARLHNNANVLAIPARFVSEEEGLEILNTFLKTEFEGGRHQSRVNKIKIG